MSWSQNTMLMKMMITSAQSKMFWVSEKYAASPPTRPRLRTAVVISRTSTTPYIAAKITTVASRKPRNMAPPVP